MPKKGALHRRQPIAPEADLHAGDGFDAFLAQQRRRVVRSLGKRMEKVTRAQNQKHREAHEGHGQWMTRGLVSGYAGFVQTRHRN